MIQDRDTVTTNKDTIVLYVLSNSGKISSDLNEFKDHFVLEHVARFLLEISEASRGFSAMCHRADVIDIKTAKIRLIFVTIAIDRSTRQLLALLHLMRGTS